MRRRTSRCRRIRPSKGTRACPKLRGLTFSPQTHRTHRRGWWLACGSAPDTHDQWVMAADPSAARCALRLNPRWKADTSGLFHRARSKTRQSRATAEWDQKLTLFCHPPTKTPKRVARPRRLFSLRAVIPVKPRDPSQFTHYADKTYHPGGSDSCSSARASSRSTGFAT